MWRSCYYNSAYGVTATAAPNQNLYLSYGIYDGDLALGDQTGLWAAPRFNGYYFNIAELGGGWVLGSNKFPGSAAIGGWDQTGTLSLTSTPATISQSGTQGFLHLRLAAAVEFARGSGGPAASPDFSNSARTPRQRNGPPPGCSRSAATRCWLRSKSGTQRPSAEISACHCRRVR
jgi:hypothetical protein